MSHRGVAAAHDGPGLYIHVPFCSRVCPYCDFAVVTGGRVARERFVVSLLDEIRLWSGEPGPFDTVYFGGGTPSILEPHDLGRILRTLTDHLQIRDDAWIVLEANPEDVTPDTLRCWLELGVRTVSLGVQSFDAGALGFLGRRHRPEDARRTVRLAREAGFHTVSVDLIYGLPGQDGPAWRRDLEAAIALDVDHLSCYQLTVHEGTVFGKRKTRGSLTELAEEAQAELFCLTHRFLNDQGLPGYEVSNFARSVEHQSRHNLKYWNHTPYLGLGPSAHSYSDDRRWWNERSLAPWQRRIASGQRPIAGKETLSREQIALEALMMGLRSYEGVDLGAVEDRWEVGLAEANRALIEELVQQRYLVAEHTRLRPTLSGLAIADGLASRFGVAAAIGR